MSEIVMPKGIHIRLSHLLQDPVGDDDADGSLHTAAERRTYLDYAVKKLFRVLSVSSTPAFLQNVYRSAIVFLKDKAIDEDLKKQGYVNLEHYDIISIHDKVGNEIVKMDFEDRNIYSTRMSNKNYWYPSEGIVTFSDQIEGSVTIVSFDRTKLFPAFEYDDLVLTLAAERGSLNVGNTNRSQFFGASFASEIQLIGTKKASEERAQ